MPAQAFALKCPENDILWVGWDCPGLVKVLILPVTSAFHSGLQG